MARTSGKPRSEYAIQTVANALRMLEVFHSVPEMGVSDLARRLKLHKNNAFRLLATLELAGYIQQSPETENYRDVQRFASAICSNFQNCWPASAEASHESIEMLSRRLRRMCPCVYAAESCTQAAIKHALHVFHV